MKERREVRARIGSKSVRGRGPARIVTDDLDSPRRPEYAQEGPRQQPEKAQAEPRTMIRVMCIALLLRLFGWGVRLAHRSGRLDYFAASRTRVCGGINVDKNDARRVALCYPLPSRRH